MIELKKMFSREIRLDIKIYYHQHWNEKKVTNWSIGIKIDTIWALKSDHPILIAEYFLKKWEFIVAIKKLKKNCLHEDVGKKMFAETYMLTK